MKATFNIQKILIPIDFSETSYLAIEHAAFTAQLFKAELVLLHVMEKFWERFSVIVPEMKVKEPNDFANSVEKKLEEIAADIRHKYGVISTCVTTSGNIFKEVMSASNEHKVDMVVMGTHGSSGVAEFFVGSNTYKVVTQSKCPVLSVQSHSSKLGFSDILLPIDDSAHSRQKVNHAIAIAKKFASRLHILGLADGDYDELDMAKFEIKLIQISEFAESAGVSSVRNIVKATNQAKNTLEYASKTNVDLIIIMTDQEENITGRLLGTYAQQIVNHSKTPVLSIQPIQSATPW
jgi:nucleotide-binding universal stress UspA family protein